MTVTEYRVTTTTQQAPPLFIRAFSPRAAVAQAEYTLTGRRPRELHPGPHPFAYTTRIDLYNVHPT